MVARHAAADDQHALIDVKGLGGQRFVAAQLFHGNLHQLGGLVGIGLLVLADPRHMLADVGHFEHVAVEARAFHRAAEGRLMHARRTGRHHHAVEFVFVNGGLDGGLSRLGTGIHQVGRIGHVGEGAGQLRHLGAVHGAGDIAAAMADKDAYSHALPPSAALALASARASSRRRPSSFCSSGSALTHSLCKPSSRGSKPKARPMSCV